MILEFNDNDIDIQWGKEFQIMYIYLYDRKPTY